MVHVPPVADSSDNRVPHHIDGLHVRVVLNDHFIGASVHRIDHCSISSYEVLIWGNVRKESYPPLPTNTNKDQIAEK